MEKHSENDVRLFLTAQFKTDTYPERSIGRPVCGTLFYSQWSGAVQAQRVCGRKEVSSRTWSGIQFYGIPHVHESTGCRK